MKQFFGSTTRRERRFAAAGSIVALVLLVPVVAVAEPGLIPGGGPGTPGQSDVEQAVDVERGDSCRNMMAADTPTYVVCRWLTPPQDAADVAAFWGANDGANLVKAQPLPAEYARCNRKTDLSKSTTCKGGTTVCKQLSTGWYECTDETTGKTTYERYVDGKKQVRSTPPPSSTPTSSPTPTTASAAPTATTPAPDESATMSSDGNPTDISTPGVTPPTETATAQADPTASANAVPTVSAEPTTSASSPTAEPTDTSGPQEGGSAEAIAAAAKARPRLRIWLETDLADDYINGDTAFDAALQSLVTAAKQPDVVGVKFADNLAYTGFSSEQQVIRFLTRATEALRAGLSGKRLAIGVVVPELGCGASKECVTAMRDKAPLVTKQHVDRYLKAVTVDRVEVASGLFGRTYRQYKVTDPKTRKPTPITPATAGRAQWMSIKALEWDTLAQLGSREYGLAHAGDASPWNKTQATAQIDARIGTAVGLGVSTITLWGHKVVDDGQTYRLFNAGLEINPMWTALNAQRLRGRLAVVFDPATTERGVNADLAAVAKNAGEVFILI